jgi:hypothetical protein
MKPATLLAFIAACAASQAMASTCEDSFREEGDPRNGVEYQATKSIADLSAMGALGQLGAIAAADGFNVHGIESVGAGGKLTIEQAKGVARPFLIHIEATPAGSAAQVSISTRLNRGVTAKQDDMRRNMCGMLHRVKSGAEGEQLAKAGLQRQAAGGVVEISATELARDLHRLKKQVGGDQAGASTISARHAGKKYLLDGQVYEPLDQGNRVDIWYRTYKEPGFLNSTEDQNSVYWATIVCQMQSDQASRAMKLQGHDWAKLEGTASHYELGTPDRFVLRDCRFR